MSDVLKSFVLILNPAKCGSTWLAQALTIRPHIVFRREYDFLYFVSFPHREQWNRKTADDPDFLGIRDDSQLSADEKVLAVYALERQRSPKCRLLIDKAPSNIHSFKDFRHLYRDTKIIVLHRDPRDCYVSNELFHQRQLHRIELHDDIGDPDYMLEGSVFRTTVNNCRKALDAENLLRQEGFELVRVTYEEMKADFSRTMWRILAYLAPTMKPWTIVRSPFFPRLLPLALHVRKTRDLRPRLFRKGIVGDWRNHIKGTAAKRLVKDHCADLLVDLGYEKDADW